VAMPLLIQTAVETATDAVPKEPHHLKAASLNLDALAADRTAPGQEASLNVTTDGVLNSVSASARVACRCFVEILAASVPDVVLINTTSMAGIMAGIEGADR
jgi:hypothetical protein